MNLESTPNPLEKPKAKRGFPRSLDPLGEVMALLINNRGVALLSNAPGFGTGQIRLDLQLNEAD